MYARTFTSFTTEEFCEADTSLEDTQFQRIATEARHKQNAVRWLICRHVTETITQTRS